MKYMLDTNICIYAQKGNASILQKIKEHWEEGLTISSITLAELQYGVKNSTNPDRNTIALMKFLSIVEIVPFDSNAAIEYGDIRSDLRKKGTPIGEMDMLISAHARAENFTLVTHNTREFERVEKLSLDDWYE